MSDPINSPDHYVAGGVEVIDIIEAFELNYRLGNVIKYVLRADRKGNRLTDLRKAQWYLDREITTVIEGERDDLTQRIATAVRERVES